MGIKTYKHNGKQYYQVYVQVRDKKGNRLQKKTKFDDNKDRISSLVKAKKIEFSIRRDLEEQKDGRSTWTWEDWWQECLRRMTYTMKESTRIGYEGELRKWVSPEWMALRLDEIDNKLIFDFIHEEMPDRGATPNTRLKILKKIRRIFQLAIDEKIINFNPAAGISVKIPESVEKVLNSSEANILLEEAFNLDHPFKDIWTFCLYTGCRSGELKSLRWSDIDFVTKQISINKQFTRRDGLHPTKTYCNRIIPISDEFLKFLQEYKLRTGGGFSRELWKWADKNKTQKIFFVVDDLILNQPREWQSEEQAHVLKEFCEDIKITPVCFKDLRATFITNLLAQGVALAKVMKIAGHKKISTTERYLRLAGVDVEDATEFLGYRIPEKKNGKVILLKR